MNALAPLPGPAALAPPAPARSVVLGIDPGASGALAFLGDDGGLEIEDMPTHEITVRGKKRRVLDLYELARIVDAQAQAVRLAVVEDARSMPGQGVASSFAFGFACGAAQAVVAANFIPMRLVSPAAWKRQLGLSRDKDASRRKASQVLPVHAGLWSRVKDNGRAEAALLAWYGRTLEMPGLPTAAPLRDARHQACTLHSADSAAQPLRRSARRAQQ